MYKYILARWRFIFDYQCVFHFTLNDSLSVAFTIDNTKYCSHEAMSLKYNIAPFHLIGALMQKLCVKYMRPHSTLESIRVPIVGSVWVVLSVGNFLVFTSGYCNLKWLETFKRTLNSCK